MSLRGKITTGVPAKQFICFEGEEEQPNLSLCLCSKAEQTSKGECCDDVAISTLVKYNIILAKNKK